MHLYKYEYKLHSKVKSNTCICIKHKKKPVISHIDRIITSNPSDNVTSRFKLKIKLEINEKCPYSATK